MKNFVCVILCVCHLFFITKELKEHNDGNKDVVTNKATKSKKKSSKLKKKHTKKKKEHDDDLYNANYDIRSDAPSPTI